MSKGRLIGGLSVIICFAGWYSVVCDDKPAIDTVQHYIRALVNKQSFVHETAVK